MKTNELVKYAAVALLVLALAGCGNQKKLSAGFQAVAPPTSGPVQPSGDSRFPDFVPPPASEQEVEPENIMDLFAQLLAAEGEALNIAIRDLSLLIANNVKAINELSKREVVFGCATAHFSPSSQSGASERVNVPSSVSDSSIFSGLAFPSESLSYYSTSKWGASCQSGWIRTGCGGAELGEWKNTPAGMPASLTSDADIHAEGNGCYAGNTEAFGLRPRVAITCCRNFTN